MRFTASSLHIGMHGLLIYQCAFRGEEHLLSTYTLPSSACKGSCVSHLAKVLLEVASWQILIKPLLLLGKENKKK